MAILAGIFGVLASRSNATCWPVTDPGRTSRVHALIESIERPPIPPPVHPIAFALVAIALVVADLGLALRERFSGR